MYLVFARKYRPERFEEVVGQEHIARTLQHALRNGRVAHAYLFCGCRGVGKTTMARILAKALNCAEGPTPEPCCQCDACRRIATGNFIDVREIDGASNRGIDEIRKLRENVAYAPAQSRYKVYYIDEVHMLTAPAFNALLKTLEEPPSHVKFIFSTTDPQQLPETVKSRCQRFDFRRISDAQIIGHLESICQKEGLQAQKGALQAMARAARGSLRDALGTLDQVASFSEGELQLKDVLQVLGAVEREVLTDLVDALAREDAGEALSVLHGVLFAGADVQDFADQLSEYLRDLLVASYCGYQDEMLAASAADADTLKRQAALFSADQLTYMIQLLREAKLRAKRDTLGRLALELAVVKMSRLSGLVVLEEALGELSGTGPDAVGATGMPASQSASSGGAARAALRNIRAKLQNAGEEPAAGRVAEQTPAPEGMDAARFRQLQRVAEDRGAAEELAQEGPLLKAFAEASGVFNLEPIKLKRLETEREDTEQAQEPESLEDGAEDQ